MIFSSLCKYLVNRFKRKHIATLQTTGLKGYNNLQRKPSSYHKYWRLRCQNILKHFLTMYIVFFKKIVRHWLIVNKIFYQFINQGYWKFIITNYWDVIKNKLVVYIGSNSHRLGVDNCFFFILMKGWIHIDQTKWGKKFKNPYELDKMENNLAIVLWWIKV